MPLSGDGDFSLHFIFLVLLRLFIAFLPLQHYLQNDHLLSSPLTSYSRLQEGLFLFKQSIDPYRGGSFRHSPLLLSLFSTIPVGDYAAPILWTFCDALSALALSSIFAARHNKLNSRSSIAAAYLFNPYLLLPSLACSTSSFENLLLVGAIYYACRGKRSLSLSLLAFLFHLSISPIAVVAPIAMLLSSSPQSGLSSPKPFTLWRALVPPIAEFIAYAGIMFGISTAVCGNLSWVEPTWGTIFTLPDLTPNPGLWWYFFTEMFDHFRPFFLVVFSVNLVVYIAPICIKFQHDPLYASFILIGIMGMFKPYPTLADSGLFITMLSIFPETFPYLNNAIVTALLHLHASLLLPLFNRLWLAQGTGNANFFYASTLVFGMANGFAVTDCIWAGIRAAFGERRSGWDVVQVYEAKPEFAEPAVVDER